MKIVKLSLTLVAALGASLTIFAVSARAENFNIPSGALAAALDTYTATTGVDLVVSAQALKGVRTKGVNGNMSPSDALARLLENTGFGVLRESGALAIVRTAPR